MSKIKVEDYPLDESGNTPLYSAFKYALQLDALGYSVDGLHDEIMRSEDLPTQALLDMVQEQLNNFALDLASGWLEEDNVIIRKLRTCF